MNRRFVIDTSIFVNPQARKGFGKTPSSALKKFLQVIKKKKNIEVFISPNVLKELGNFVDKKLMEELVLYIKLRSPNKYATYLPAAVFYEFIEDIRERINKGLRLAEEFAKDNRPDNAEKLRKLRDKYRAALREGILDSTEDFELVLLAKELNAVLVTSDEGMIKFANSVGCEWLQGEAFYRLLKRLK